jgi:Periplasmic copper-binding protein (NosD)
MNLKKKRFANMPLVFVGLLLFCCASVSAQGNKTLVVDDNLACPGATYTSIQAAVAAAPAGATINVCPGVYNEQVRINKPLTVRGVEFANQNAAIVKPAPALPNSTGTTSGIPIAAIILAENAARINLENLTVDGATNGINGCAPVLVGVYYRNASGTVDSLAVRNVRLGTGLEGCQSGLGILVQSSTGNESKVDIFNNSVHDYQKNGITANEAGTDVWVKGNAVTGIGPTADIAQNGIQIGFGAKGRVEENSVINHIYSLCVSLSDCSFSASDIIIQDSNDVRVTKNNVGKSQTNIFVIGNGADIKDNTVFDTDVFDGIALIGDNNKVQNNRIFNSDEAGVFVMGNNNKVKTNTINEAPIGILEFAPSSGNDFNPNRFFNTGVNIVPAASSAAAPANSLQRSGASDRAPASTIQP